LVTAFQKLEECDRELAGNVFPAAMRRAKKMSTLEALTFTAIDAELYNPVWTMLGEIDYSYRTDLAETVGAACEEHPKVGKFMQGAYYGLKSTDFVRWAPVLTNCPSPKMREWIETVLAAPPNSPFNEKYDAMMGALVKIAGPDALPVLEAAAVKAAEGGPFANILDRMNGSVQPKELGQNMDPALADALRDAYLRVANAVPPTQAAMVADRLYNANYETEAGSLLPVIYADRVQPNGALIYGAIAVESCDGSAWVHWTTIEDSGARWSIGTAAEEQLSQFKAKLKCDAEWRVVTMTEPAETPEFVETWAHTASTPWTEQGLKIKYKAEKPVVLP